MSLTSNKDTDIQILVHLNDKTLSNVSLVNKYMYSLYKDNNLWRYKFCKKYNVQVVKDTDYLYKNYTWEKLYKKLKYDHISVMQKAFEYKKTDLVISLFENYDVGDEEIIDMIMEALLFSYMEFVYLFFESKRVQSFQSSSLTELFRVSCDNDSRTQVEETKHIELFFLLQKAGLVLEAYDLIFAIRGKNLDILKSILFRKELRNDIIMLTEEIYKEAIEIYENDSDPENSQILKTLHESYLVAPPRYKKFLEDLEEDIE